MIGLWLEPSKHSGRWGRGRDGVPSIWTLVIHPGFDLDLALTSEWAWCAPLHVWYWNPSPPSHGPYFCVLTPNVLPETTQMLRRMRSSREYLNVSLETCREYLLRLFCNRLTLGSRRMKKLVFTNFLLQDIINIFFLLKNRCKSLGSGSQYFSWNYKMNQKIFLYRQYLSVRRMFSFIRLLSQVR